MTRSHLSSDDRRTRIPWQKDLLFFSIICAAVFLAFLSLVLYGVWGTGRVIGEIPWYIPVMQGCTGLAAISIAFLALGRYPVLREAPAYWGGVGFGAFGIEAAFFVLAWPGFLPAGAVVLARLQNTTGWIALYELASTSLFLLLADLSRWPGWSANPFRKTEPLSGGGWLWTVAAWFAGIICICLAAWAFETAFPLVIDPRGGISAFGLTLSVVFLCLSLIGAVLSTLRYRQTGDRLMGFVALTQIMVAFVILAVVIGGKRFDPWFYLRQLVQAIGFVTLMFGLLSEYVRLYRRERENEGRFHTLFANMVEAFFLVEPVEDQDRQAIDYRFLDANSAAERFFGKSRAEIIGKTSAEALGKADP